MTNCLRLAGLAATVSGVLAISAFSAQAAISEKAVRKEVESPQMPATHQALRLPIGQRMSALQEQGKQGYRNLRQIMNDEKQPMESRWRAVMAVALLGGSESKPEIERALKAREWFMRNAGLIAMTKVDRQAAITWSRKLMSDKALVVRAAAVDTLAELKDSSSTALLWEKLNAKENFKGKQSLFIRRRIVETLAQLETTGRESRFVALLSDRDETLHPPAIRALERITSKKMGEQEPVKFQRAQWQRWWKENSATM